MKRAGLEDPICSLPSLGLWSLFEVKETSSQRKAPRRDRSDEDQVLCALVGIIGTDKTKQREEDTLEMWSKGLCYLLLLNSVKDPELPLWLKSPFIPNLWVLQIKKISLCLELDLQWSQLKHLPNLETQMLVNMYYVMPFFLKSLH